MIFFFTVINLRYYTKGICSYRVSMFHSSYELCNNDWFSTKFRNFRKTRKFYVFFFENWELYHKILMSTNMLISLLKFEVNISLTSANSRRLRTFKKTGFLMRTYLYYKKFENKRWRIQNRKPHTKINCLYFLLFDGFYNNYSQFEDIFWKFFCKLTYNYCLYWHANDAVILYFYRRHTFMILNFIQYIITSKYRNKQCKRWRLRTREKTGFWYMSYKKSTISLSLQNWILVHEKYYKNSHLPYKCRKCTTHYFLSRWVRWNYWFFAKNIVFVMDF